MNYTPFYGPHKNIVELADKIIATNGNMDGEISDATNLYYSMKLIAEIDRLYRDMYFYGGNSVIAMEIKGHILKLQKALGLLNESKSITEYFSDIAPSSSEDHPYVKLLTECRDKGMPFDSAVHTVSSIAGIPEYQLRKFIENEKIDYPSIDIALPVYADGEKLGVSMDDKEALSNLLRSKNTLLADMVNSLSERMSMDPSSYFKNKHPEVYISNTNFSKGDSEVVEFSSNSNNCSGSTHVYRSKDARLNSYIAGILSTKNFSQEELSVLKLKSKIVQFSTILDNLINGIKTDDTSTFILKMKESNLDKLSAPLLNYMKKINIKEVLGNN